MSINDSYYKGLIKPLSFDSPYFRNKSSLREKIRKNSDDLTVSERKPDFHACYFCSKRITDDYMKTLRVKENLILGLESTYYLHNRCYNKALNHDYILDMPFSPN